jgi:hypothetical protein
MDSRRTVFPPAHCNILTTDFRLLNTSMPQLRQEVNMRLYGDGFGAFRLLYQGAGSRVARLCKRLRARIPIITLAIARKRSRRGMPVGRTGRVRAAGRQGRVGKRAKTGSLASRRGHVRRSRSASRMEFAGKKAKAENFENPMVRANHMVREGTKARAEGPTSRMRHASRTESGKRAARADSASPMLLAKRTGNGMRAARAEVSVSRMRHASRMGSGRRAARADFGNPMVRASPMGRGGKKARAEDSANRRARASPTARAGQRVQAEDSASRRDRVRRAANGRRKAAACGRYGGSPANGGRMTNSGGSCTSQETIDRAGRAF